MKATLQLLAWCLIGVGLVVACVSSSSTMPSLPELVAAGPGVPLEQLLQRTGAPKAALLEREAAGEPLRGNVRMIFPATPCWPAGGVNPYAWPMRTTPTAGSPIVVEFTTRALAPYPEADAWLLLSTHPLQVPVPLDTIGGTGCQIVVAAESVVPIHAGVPLSAGLILRDPAAFPGCTWLAWTPPASAVGLHLYAQLVVHAPGENRAGLIVSPGVELLIGQQP